MFVTLKDLRQQEACFEGYNKVVRALQGKEFTHADTARETYIRFAHKDPISVESIVTSNDLDDALWALRCVEGRDRDLRLFAVWCARQVQHLMTDKRSLDALDVAERFANGEATQYELGAAWAAARAAARAAASGAARAAAWDAAWGAAWDAASGAARAAAWDATRDAQTEMLIKMCRGQAPWQIQQPEGAPK